MQNSQSQWIPDPSLPPEEAAFKFSGKNLGVIAAFTEFYRLQHLGFIRFVRAWARDPHHIRLEVRRIMRGERPVKGDFPGDFKA